MAGFAQYTALFGLLLFTVVGAHKVFQIPNTDLFYQVQRASALPMSLKCPTDAYKYIEVRGVSLANESTVIPAVTLYPSIERVTKEECLASSMNNPDDGNVQCTIAMNDIPFDEDAKKMDKAVVFDCRKTLSGDSASEVKTITKKKGTINIKCPDKNDIVKIISITLASGMPVNVAEATRRCNEENIKEMGKGSGGHCQIKRNGVLNASEMTVKYQCSSPPKREFEEFVYSTGEEKKHGQKGKGGHKS